MKEKERGKLTEGLTRRHFVKGGAGAVLAASCLATLGPRATALAAGSSQSAGAKIYICPPCGLPCDKLTFDKPGSCPQCGMTLIPAGDSDDGPLRVAILVYNGTQLIDITGPWEAFGTAGFRVHTVAEDLEPVTLVFGQKMIPDYTFENSPKAEILLVPGGGIGAMKNQRLIQWVQDKSKDVSHIMSVCTGAFILAKAGLLAGQTATCTYGMVEDLLTFPNIKVVYDARYVDSGKIITTAGLSSGIDGAIHLISKTLSKGEAQSVALNMEYHWDPESKWARGAMADRYLPDGLAFGNAKIKGAQAKMISTEGDTNRWETKILVSEPNSSAKILDLLRERIAANTGVGGMSNRISHVRGALSFSPAGNTRDSEIRWKFTDDRGRNWGGQAVIESAPDGKEKFVVTLRLATKTITS